VQNTDLIGLRSFFGTEAGTSGGEKSFFLEKVNYYQGKMSTFGSLAPPRKSTILPGVLREFSGASRRDQEAPSRPYAPIRAETRRLQRGPWRDWERPRVGDGGSTTRGRSAGKSREPSRVARLRTSEQQGRSLQDAASAWGWNGKSRSGERGRHGCGRYGGCVG